MNRTKRTRLLRYAQKRCQRCGRPNPDYPLVNCKPCARLAGECKRRLVAKRTALELCPKCGLDREDNDKKTCRACREQYNEWNRRSEYDRKRGKYKLKKGNNT